MQTSRRKLVVHARTGESQRAPLMLVAQEDREALDDIPVDGPELPGRRAHAEVLPPSSDKRVDGSDPISQALCSSHRGASTSFTFCRTAFIALVLGHLCTYQRPRQRQDSFNR